MTKENVISTIENIRYNQNQRMGIRSPGLLAKRPLIGLLMFLFGGLAFGVLYYNLRIQGPLLKWDIALATVLPAIGLRTPNLLRPIMDIGYYLGTWGIGILVVTLAIYFLVKRTWQELAMLVIGQIGTTLLFWSLSNLIGRVRPSTQIWIILKIPGFPSGHALAVVTIFGLVAYLLVPKMHSAFGKALVVFVAVFLMLFVGFTRVFTAAHYLTDVLAGYALGITWSGAAFTLIEIYFKNGRG